METNFLSALFEENSVGIYKKKNNQKQNQQPNQHLYNKKDNILQKKETYPTRRKTAKLTHCV